jgi:hypothetical protein
MEIITYEENLLGPNGESKPGVNKVTKDENDNLIGKEYLPGGKPKSVALQALMSATPNDLIIIKQLLGI